MGLLGKGLLSGIVLASSLQAADLTVNSTSKKQTIEGFGGGSVYYTNWLTAHPNRQALYDTLFTGLGLTYMRIGNWNQDSTSALTDDSTIVAEGKKRLGSRMRLLMSSWSAPGWMKVSGNVNGADSAGNYGRRKNTLKRNASNQYMYTDFAHWWKRSLLKYQAKGMMPDDVSMQNEPDMNADYQETLFEPTESDTIAGYAQAFSAVADSLATLSTKPRMLGPEVLGIGWSNVTNYTAKMDLTKAGAVNFHLYHAGSYANPDGFNSDVAKIAATITNKPLVMSEYCNMSGDFSYNMINGAKIIQDMFTKGNVSGYVNWELFWGGGGQTVALENPWTPSAWKTTNGYTIKPEYHGLRHFSRFTGRGWSRVDALTTDTLVRTVAFVNPAADSLTVVVLNLAATTQTVNLSPAGWTLRERWYSQTGGVMSQYIAPTAGQTSYSLGDSSITTFVFKPTANSAPTNVALSATSIAENQATGTTVGTLSATDPDAGNTFTYTLVSGTGSTDNASFSISGTTLKSAASFDYETKNSYSIRVRVTDQGGLYYEKVFTIAVTNVNEAPTNVALSATSIAENQATGTTVGTLSATDPDAGSSFTFSMAPTGTDNASFTVSGTTLKTAQVFNYKTKASYSINLRVADQGGLTFDKAFTIAVLAVSSSSSSSLASSSSVAVSSSSVLKSSSSVALSSSSSLASSSSVAASSSSVLKSSSSVAVSSSSSLASSSSVVVSSSAATTSLGYTEALASGRVACYEVFDMLGHRQSVNADFPLNLPQGRWIVVARGLNGQRLGSSIRISW